jgi:hypothetical protein
MRLNDYGNSPAATGVEAQPGSGRIHDRWSRLEELYDLAADPGERTNLCTSAPARCVPFREQAAAWETTLETARARLGPKNPASATIDAQTRDRLRALGYAE